MKPSLLDTDILSFYFRGDEQVMKAVQVYLTGFSSLSFSIVTYYEILSGLMHRDAQNQMSAFLGFASENHILPLTEQSVTISSKLYASLRKSGAPVDDIDLLIAGVALANDLVLVTHNTAHFSRIPDLQTADWTLLRDDAV